MYITKINFNKNGIFNNNTQHFVSNIKRCKKTGEIKKIKDNPEISEDIKDGTFYFNIAPEVYQSKNILLYYSQFFLFHEYFLKDWSELTCESKASVFQMKEDMENMHVKVVIVGMLFTYLFFITKSNGSKILIDDGNQKIEFKEISVKKGLTPGELLHQGEEKNFKGNLFSFNEGLQSKSKIIKNFTKENEYFTADQIKKDIITKGTYFSVETEIDEIEFDD